MRTIYFRDPNFTILLVGKTSSGKSATGNTILRKESFSLSTVTSTCDKDMTKFDGKILAVVDTPDLFGSRLSEDAMTKEISRCISFSAPGPHVFLVVISANRFTEEEQKTVKNIQKIFGEAAARYTMVLFTRGDDLKTNKVSIEKVIKRSKPLSDLIKQCEGRYHVFNNKDEDPSQVRELLKKISSMVQRNGGSCFTNEKLREADRANKAEPKIAKVEIDPSNIPNGVIVTATTVAGAAGVGVGAAVGSGAAAGAAAAAAAGPVGAVIGAGVGAVVGGVTVAVKEGCVIQ